MGDAKYAMKNKASHVDSITGAGPQFAQNALTLRKMKHSTEDLNIMVTYGYNGKLQRTPVYYATHEKTQLMLSTLNKNAIWNQGIKTTKVLLSTHTGMEIIYIDIDVHRLLMDTIAEEQRIEKQRRNQDKQREESTAGQTNNTSYKIKNGKLYKVRPPPGLENPTGTDTSVDWVKESNKQTTLPDVWFQAIPPKEFRNETTWDPYNGMVIRFSESHCQPGVIRALCTSARLDNWMLATTDPCRT